MIYGGKRDVEFWHRWFAARPDFADWSDRSLGNFESVGAVLFMQKPIPKIE